MKKVKITLIILIMFLFIFNIDKINAASDQGNFAKISSSVVTQVKTGTGPFDANDEPGNDSSENNDIVRSFDQVTWTIENTMVLKDSTTESINGGIIHIEAELPQEYANLMRWDLNSMGWTEGTGTVSSDGIKFSASYQMNEDNVTVPGKQTLILVLKVDGALNGTKITPKVTVWIEGNEDNEKVEVKNFNTVTVSAAPKYNIKLARNTGLYKEIEIEENGVKQRGRLYGYAIGYQLYNETSSKGLKGIEYPTGDIDLTVDLKLEKTKIGNSSDVEDITLSSTPMLYNYKLNNTADKGIIPNRNMSVTRHAGYYGSFPWSNRSANASTNTLERYCYDSGNINITQEANKLNLKLSDYKFDGKFPLKNGFAEANQAYDNYTSNIGFFSTIYFQVFVPYTDESTEAGYNYYLTVSDESFSATSLSGQKVTKQMVTNDDSDRLQHYYYREGSFARYHWLQTSFSNTTGLYSYYTRGDAKATIGQKFVSRLDFASGTNNDISSDVYDANALLKFDGSVLDVTEIDGITWRERPGNATNTVNSNDMQFKMLYAAKPDGTNWSSDEEMGQAEEEDLLFFDSIEQLKAQLGDNAICVGVLYESISGSFGYSSGCTLELALQVNENAKIGDVYQFVSVIRLYFEDNKLDRTTQTRSNPDAVFPDEDVQMKSNYVKTKYDDSGNIMTGTHSGGYAQGQSLLIVGGNVSILKEVNDKTDSGSTKVNYDLGRNEYEVEYKLTPKLTKIQTTSGEIQDVTVTVQDTLPEGLTYVQNSSSYGEPEITNNGNGTTTLTWQIYNCQTNKDIEPIIFKAKIDEESTNGTLYTNTVLVSADKIGPSLPTTRTATVDIQVTNLSAHRLYKTISTPVIEKNGEIHFRVVYKNNTDGVIPDFQMLDILPYNGDSRGTNYTGDYTLDRLVVTQTNEAGDKISNDNLQILYTNDGSVRNGITSKDENLGQGWNSINSETIKQKATAYVVKGEIGAQGSVTVDIYLKTNGNKGLDKYVNSATAQVYKETEEMVTSNVVSQVVERKIEGIAWEDSNRNGVKDEGEQVLSNVEINLTDELGQQVTDVNGNKVTSIKTDENGYYKFENLPKGEYYVQVKIPNEKYELTEKQVGTNNEINSKFNEEEKETDKIEGLNSIDLPELTVSYVNVGFVKIEGSIEITKVNAKDNSKLIEGATFKVEKLDEEGNVDSTYNIEEQTTGEEGKVLFEGLEVGKYRVTETKAPSGYELLEKSIEVEITGENRDIKLTAENELKLILPLTGDTNNTIGLIIIGAIMIGISVILFVKYEGKVLIEKV